MLVSAAQSTRCNPALQFSAHARNCHRVKKCNSTRLHPYFPCMCSSALTISYLKVPPCASLNLFEWFNYLADGLYKLDKLLALQAAQILATTNSIDKGYSARRMTVCVPTLSFTRLTEAPMSRFLEHACRETYDARLLCLSSPTLHG